MSGKLLIAQTGAGDHLTDKIVNIYNVNVNIKQQMSLMSRSTMYRCK